MKRKANVKKQESIEIYIDGRGARPDGYRFGFRLDSAENCRV